MVYKAQIKNGASKKVDITETKLSTKRGRYPQKTRGFPQFYVIWGVMAGAGCYIDLA